jgi:DNA-binding CsgD family transcriptional regulator
MYAQNRSAILTNNYFKYDRANPQKNQEVGVEGGIYMTEREKTRADLFSQISQIIISQAEAARQLGLSIRHVQRLYALYRKLGLKH